MRSVLVLACAGLMLAGRAAAGDDGRAVKLSLEDDQSVYAPPGPPSPTEGVNAGGVNLDMLVSYMTDYVYRGVEQREAGAREDAANYQFDGKLQFDLRQLPHPFVGMFVNVQEGDPISDFQEMRPYFGAEWRIRPFIFEAGNISYLYPDRDELNTAEVYGKVTIDDAVILKADNPVLSPYVYGAYDYDLYNGWYLEGGITHDFVIEGTGIVLTASASVAYVMGLEQFAAGDGDQDGFQHYQFSLVGRYSLNNLLNIPRHYGRWSLNGYVSYTDGITDRLRADTQVWGGAAIQFTY